MKFVLITGPQAVGKMTVGQELEKITDDSHINEKPILSTQMIVTPAAVGNYFNVSASIFLDVPAGCCQNISVKNTGTTSADIQNANLIIERVA